MKDPTFKLNTKKKYIAQRPVQQEISVIKDPGGPHRFEKFIRIMVVDYEGNETKNGKAQQPKDDNVDERRNAQGSEIVALQDTGKFFWVQEKGAIVTLSKPTIELPPLYHDEPIFYAWNKESLKTAFNNGRYKHTKGSVQNFVPKKHQREEGHNACYEGYLCCSLDTKNADGSKTRKYVTGGRNPSTSAKPKKKSKPVKKTSSSGGTKRKNDGGVAVGKS